MNWLLLAIKAYWLEVLLIAGLVTAILYVHKRKEKYAKNEFE
jgi:hypothetical protein